jgi:TetR/AcrR family transcriptional regulator, transcriptional repressor for nem operon
MGRPQQFESEVAVNRAVEVFWHNGYAATTPQGLASELGIGKGSLYNTFQSKHNLFVLALRRYSAQRLERLRDGLNATGPVKPLLRAAIETLTGVGQHHRGCFAVNSATALAGADAEVPKVTDELFAGVEDAFGEAIRRGQASGEIDAGRDAKQLAGTLLAVVVGISVLAQTPDGTARAIRVLDAAIDDL